MQWTAELDKSLAELHAKRLGNAFIAKWLRLDSSLVRARLAELGLSKARSAAAAAPPPTNAPAESLDADDDDMVAINGCPRGYLLSERRIASIYQSVGRGY